MNTIRGAKVAMLGLSILVGGHAIALPNCPVNPGSEFGVVYNLFDSAVSGPQTLRAITSCSSLKVTSGQSYLLIAEPEQFQIFANGATSNDAVVTIAVPSDGDYVTMSKCADGQITSNEILANKKHLHITAVQDKIAVDFASEHCELKICPKFGSCQ